MRVAVIREDRELLAELVWLNTGVQEVRHVDRTAGRHAAVLGAGVLVDW
ncbi:MAG TPA: hypothetical protein VK887_10160 [Pseudonocardiaceae bacterium]|nr:hypothetical protein [Pseudonocardiaceae bacterium]